MNRIKFIGLLFVCTLLFTKHSTAQLSGSNLAEYQFGNIPGVEPGDQSSLYEQLNLKYRYKGLSLYTRVEFYTPSFGVDLDYLRLSQYRASYSTKVLNLEVGHLYNSFGRGLLMRNYEIPSSIYEDRGYRVRYGFYKDMHGLSAKYKSKHVNVKVMRGQILTVDLPPTLPENERRPDLVEGAEVEGNYEGHQLGLIFMRHHNTGKKSNYGSLFYSKSISSFGFYGELAKRVDSLESISSFASEQAYGAYLGFNYGSLLWGGSFELKKYNNFAIGNGVNDPPTLIKEHSSRLLNRNTHVPLIANESGYQLEIFANLNNGGTLTFNNALSWNELATNSYLFREFYLEYFTYLGDKNDLKIFADYSIDPLNNEPSRITGGVIWDIKHAKLSSSINMEAQQIKRELSTLETIMNYLFSYTIAKARKFSLTAQIESSADPIVLEEGKTINIYPAGVVSYHFDKRNKLTVFAGKRRGGPACTSGVCYDVLDFEGIELRLNTRF